MSRKQHLSRLMKYKGISLTVRIISAFQSLADETNIVCRSPTIEDAISSQEYPNAEASARWSTATVTILKSDVSANPAFAEQASTTPQPVQNTKSSLLDGKILASASADKIVRLWDSTASRTLEGHSREVLAVTFSPDGKTLASASRDETVMLWDSTTGAVRHTLEGHSGVVRAVTFSPGGKTLASASEDKTVRLWDSTTGAARHTLKGHSDVVRAVTFSPDGKTLVSASRDETVRLWDLKVIYSQ